MHDAVKGQAGPGKPVQTYNLTRDVLLLSTRFMRSATRQAPPQRPAQRALAREHSAARDVNSRRHTRTHAPIRRGLTHGVRASIMARALGPRRARAALAALMVTRATAGGQAAVSASHDVLASIHIWR